MSLHDLLYRSLRRSCGDPGEILYSRSPRMKIVQMPWIRGACMKVFLGCFEALGRFSRKGLVGSSLWQVLLWWSCEVLVDIFVPVVPHKAVAEVSEEETYRRGWLLWITDGRAAPLIDRKVVGAVFVEVVAMVAVVTSPTTAGFSVVCCSCSRSCSVVESCSCGVV